MTRVFLLGLLALAFCFTGVNQSVAAGEIVLSADAAGTNCNLVDVAPGFVEAHVWVRNTDGILAIQFYAPVPDCWEGAAWLSDNVAPYISIGWTQDPEGGLSVAFGECLEDNAYVGKIVIATQGTGQTCCEYPILKASNDKHPEIDGPIVVNCVEPLHVLGATAGAVVNADGSCGCALTPLPVEETSWGKVKALYQ